MDESRVRELQRADAIRLGIGTDQNLEKNKEITRMDAVRFIAVYEHGFDKPFTALILGSEEKRVETMMETLAADYGVQGKLLYAGYLEMFDGKVSIYRGGSVSLEIENDDAKNQKVLEEIRRFKVLTDVYIHHIAGGEISSGMYKTGSLPDGER
jgi:hypothetical protein